MRGSIWVGSTNYRVHNVCAQRVCDYVGVQAGVRAHDRLHRWLTEQSAEQTADAVADQINDAVTARGGDVGDAIGSTA